MLTDQRIPAIPPSSSTELPAGGDDPARFDWAEAWYPIFYVTDLDRARLHKFTLMNRDLVIWWEQHTAQWRVLEDQCPHRLAPLSEGRIAEDGLLECPYHGWAFRGDGTCDRIPQQSATGTAHTSPRACVASLPTVERQGLLFVYAGTPERAARVPVPVIAPLQETPDGWVCLDTFRDLPYDALTLLENVLDASHVPFTHHRSVGDRANAAPVDLELLETGKQGFRGTWAEGPRKGTLGRQDTTFIAPALMWHDLTSRQFGRTLTVVYATPIRKGMCRLFARFPFKFASPIPAFLIRLSPRWYSHLSQNRILEDDQIFLHAQERYLQARGGSSEFARAFFLPTRADAFTTALRQWVTHFQADPFPNQPLPTALPTEALLDRYQSHTLHCASCRRALHIVQRSRWAIGLVGAIAWASVPLLVGLIGQGGMAIAMPVILLILGGAWLWLGTLEQQFYQGHPIPPRNLPG